VPAEVASVLADLAVETDRLFAILEDLGGRAGTLLTRDDRLPPTLSVLSALDGYLVSTLDAESAAAGAGIVLAPGALVDQHRWIHWFWKPPQRPAERLRVNLDPVSYDCYDYTSTEWYRRGREAGAACVTGPYVDYVCSNEYVVTLTTPIGEGAGFVGLAGIDVRVAHLEELLLPRLLAVDGTAAVVTADGRVVSSTSAGLAPGSTLDAARASTLSLRERLEATRPPLPWRVLVGPPPSDEQAEAACPGRRSGPVLRTRRSG
jgi:hypothetical protein